MENSILPNTFKGPKERAPRNRHRKPWADVPGVEFHAKTEVAIGGKLNVERRETYLGTGGIHIKDETTRFLQCVH